MKAWYEEYELPPPGNMMSPAESGREDFIKLGTEIFGNIESAILSHYGKIDQDLKILEFGCGVGRIAMPFFHKYGKPDAIVDVNSWAIAFLKRVIPGAHPQATSFVPPLPFADESFDCVYSVSVWTHLPLPLQWPWLREINRILKPGGLGLISTSGFRALRYRREQRVQDGWKFVTDNDLRMEGQIYKGVDPKNHMGVTGDYGYVAHDPEWVRREWGRLFEVKDIKPEYISRMQDLNFLIKNKDIKPGDLSLL